MASHPGTSCVVVDYSCPDDCGAWVERTYPQVKVVRVPDREHFQASDARNIGVRAADAPWVCFVDADIKLDASFADTVRLLLRENRFLCAAPVERGMGGTVVCARSDFDRIGGYDRALLGYGGEDFDLYGRLVYIGVVRDTFPSQLLTLLEHDDALRVRHHQVKSMAANLTINNLYRQVKYDLMKLADGELPEPTRQQLYKTVQKYVAESLSSDEPKTLRVNGGQWKMSFGFGVDRILSYVMSKRSEPQSLEDPLASRGAGVE